jgi:5-methylcytosine-specific restriction endonuclease McrA
MARKEFPRSVKVAAVKRAMRDGEVYCEQCGVMTKGRFEIDHDKEDYYGGEPTLENARVLCVACHSSKTAKNAKIIAKTRRLEASNVGATRPKGQIKSRGFPKKERKEKLAYPPRRGIYEAEEETN